ncbi:hypothetical protein LXL04_035006 [Taraxacum kok-saghyz]
MKLSKKLSKENKERIEIDLKANRELRFSLAPNVFRPVCTCVTANKIWIKLKEMYGGNEKQLKAQQTEILSDFGLFKQKSTESLDQVFDRFNQLLSQLEKFNLAKRTLSRRLRLQLLQREESPYKILYVEEEDRENTVNDEAYYVRKLEEVRKLNVTRTNLLGANEDEWMEYGSLDLKMIKCFNQLMVQCLPEMRSRSDAASSSSGGTCLSSKGSFRPTFTVEMVVEKAQTVAVKRCDHREGRNQGDAPEYRSWNEQEEGDQSPEWLLIAENWWNGGDAADPRCLMLVGRKVIRQRRRRQQLAGDCGHRLESYISGNVNVEIVKTPKVNGEDKVPKVEKVKTENYDNERYIDSGCSRHMTGKIERLKDFRGLKGAGYVIFGNNDVAEIKGYGKLTNGEFTINKVAYVEGLMHNLISVSQLIVGTGLKISHFTFGPMRFQQSALLKIVRDASSIIRKIRRTSFNRKLMKEFSLAIHSLQRLIEFFDIPVKASTSKAKATENQGDELLKDSLCDADLGGSNLDRKNTSGGCTFLDGKLANYNSVTNVMDFDLEIGVRTGISKNIFCKLLKVPMSKELIDPDSVFGTDMISIYNQMGHTPILTRLSAFKKNKLP